MNMKKLAAPVILLILGGAYLLFGRGPKSINNNPPIQSHRSYAVEMVSSLDNIQPSQATKIIYKIKDDQGNTLKDFDVVHEKVMHFIVVRKDLQYFQHIHPSFNETSGEFEIPVTFAAHGEYRAFMDFTPSASQIGHDGEKLPVTVYEDMKVGDISHYTPLPIGSTERVKTYGDYQVTIIPNSRAIVSENNQSFDFEITKDEQVVTNVATYLGALGHTVVLREDDLQFIHAHATQKPTDPQTSRVNFGITFPEAGNYKLFSQFQHEGKIITSDFVVGVAEGQENSVGSNPHGGVQLLQQKNTSANPFTPVASITHGHGLAVDRADPNKLYIATHHGLLVLINEKDLYLVGKEKDDYMGFSPHPTDANVFFSSGHPSFGGNMGFQKSEDGGFTWKKVSNGVNGPVDFHAMTVSPVNPNLVYGWYRGNLQKSADGGKNWEIIHRDILAVQLAADGEDEQTVYAATPDGRGVLVSRNGGADWSTLSPALEGGHVSVVAAHPADTKQLLVFSEALGGLGKSIDGGASWRKISDTFAGETILHMAFQPQNSEIVYALTHKNGLYKSMDTGETWGKIR